MNILLFDIPSKGLYYHDFFINLCRKTNVFLYGPGTRYYNREHNIEDILSIFHREMGIETPDLILFGHGWEKDGSNTEYQINKNLCVKDVKIKKAFIFNKEYKKMKQKISFVAQNNIDVCFTALHEVKDIYSNVKCQVYRLPFAADSFTFKDWEMEKAIDLGFSGNLFNSGVYIDPEKQIMGNYFNNIRERIFKKLHNEEYKGLNIWWNSSQSGNFYGKKYSSLINSSKIWLNTTSAREIVGPRFFETMASCSLIFCVECPWAYNGLGIVDGETCVTFKNDLSNFEEKLFYYLEKDAERERIIKNAHKLFKENHTWGRRVDFLLNTIENIKGGFNG